MSHLHRFTSRWWSSQPNLAALVPLARSFPRRNSSIADPTIFHAISDVDKRDRFRNLYSVLKKDPRVKMPQNEFSLLCEKNGLRNEEAREVTSILHSSGLIWCDSESFSQGSCLILKPREAVEAFNDILDIENEKTHAFVKERLDKLKSLLIEIAPLEKKHDEIEKKAQNHAQYLWATFGVYVVFQCGLVPYLTFWRLSWDIMEPVTYMFNVWTLGLATWFFLGTNKDFTYDGITEVMVNSKRQRLYNRFSFDATLFNQLRREITEVTDDLVNPEWAMLKHVHPKIPDYTIYDEFDDIEQIILEIDKRIGGFEVEKSVTEEEVRE